MSNTLCFLIGSAIILSFIPGAGNCAVRLVQTVPAFATFLAIPLAIAIPVTAIALRPAKKK